LSGIPLSEITKSLVCLTPDGKAVVAVIAGDRKLNLKALAQAVGVKKMTLGPFAEAHKYSGYPPGATPPVLHRKVSLVVYDEKPIALDIIYGGGGDNGTLLKINTAQAVELSKAKVENISMD
jgi:Cys-tRNA(Pro)/Cys-tRNA(Cys) deacylase